MCVWVGIFFLRMFIFSPNASMYVWPFFFGSPKRVFCIFMYVVFVLVFFLLFSLYFVFPPDIICQSLALDLIS